MKTRIQLELPEFGLRPAVDSRLLAKFARLRNGESIAELGSGIGNISLNLAEKYNADFHGFELQPELHEFALLNKKKNQSVLKGKVNFHQKDIRDLKGLKKWQGKFDRIIFNPPWHKKGYHRLPHDPIRAKQMHELEGTLEDFLKAAKFLGKEKFTISAIFPTERLSDYKSLLKDNEMSFYSIREIYNSKQKKPIWVITLIGINSKKEFRMLKDYHIRGTE